MSRRYAAWGMVLVFARASADDASPSPAEINRAIDAGVTWLKAAQGADGSWGPCVSGGSYDGSSGGGSCCDLGPTAFSVFTLAVCGVPRDDPVIERALTWLRKRPGRDYDYTSYESAVLVLMLTALNDVKAPKRLIRSQSSLKPPRRSRFRAEDWRWMHERLQHLAESHGRTGGFGYGLAGPDDDYADVSATQFAALALRVASFAGYPVPATAWLRIIDFHVKLQDSSGGFAYHAPHKASRGMTAAAVSTLHICREQLALQGEMEPASLASAIANGLKYLDTNFEVGSNPSAHFEGMSHYHYCHLYAIERVGILSGRREFGGKDWYGRGAAFLLREQADNGCWTDMTCIKPEGILGTCFALLFLKKATIPAVTPQ